MRSEREHAWPPPSRPFNHRSTGALLLFLSVVAREKKQKEGEKNGRKKKRHMTSGLCTRKRPNKEIRRKQDLWQRQVCTALRPAAVMRLSLSTDHLAMLFLPAQHDTASGRHAPPAPSPAGFDVRTTNWME
ncbi:Os08g0169100 [Oryza sativa Japonica Group]|uniref:Os08g0169100 protein n=1 Tax=Oryza sativa subsp. japonica TaxID=39947 RepID=Q0J7R6_ORYSJ|nr:Os08g0169100 [Oryza sativa Japonica Group]|eukprot:NP_001061085.1 Os08g0169100 [Oryza sativa Japonica Group]